MLLRFSYVNYLIFSFLTALSGTSMYNSWVYSGFNFALGLPIIFYGFMDRDISGDFSLANPKVYRTGLANTALNKRTIGMWMFNAVLFAIIFCLLCFNVLQDTFKYDGLYEMGTTIFIALILSLQFKVAFLHQVWNRIHLISMLISIIGLFLVCLVINASIMEYDMYGVVNKIYTYDIFWFYGVWTIPVFMFLVDFFGQALLVFFKPSDEMIYRERNRIDDLKSGKTEKICINDIVNFEFKKYV